MAILSIDAGTTGISVLVVNRAGKAIARGYQEFEQHFPKPSWVEHLSLIHISEPTRRS